MTAWTLLIIAALTAIGFFVGQARAQGLRAYPTLVDAVGVLPHGMRLARLWFGISPTRPAGAPHASIDLGTLFLVTVAERV